MTDVFEERVFWQETFFSETLDFRGRTQFSRFDRCTFVKCTLLIDQATEHLAFTGCTFKDCNVDRIEADEARAIEARDNFFDMPIEVRRMDFEKRLAEMLAWRASRNSV
jgi:hypothetical protein